MTLASSLRPGKLVITADGGKSFDYTLSNALSGRYVPVHLLASNADGEHLALTRASSRPSILIFMVSTSPLVLIIFSILVSQFRVGVVMLLLLTTHLTVSPTLGPIGTLRIEALPMVRQKTGWLGSRVPVQMRS